MITKLCGNCGNTFETEPWWNKDYCDVRCRLTAKRDREKSRARTRKANTVQEVVSKLMNPTAIQLTTYAGMMLTKQDVTPKTFSGTIPKSWEPPEGIMFIQDGSDESCWIMARADGLIKQEEPEFNALDVLNGLQS